MKWAGFKTAVVVTKPGPLQDAIGDNRIFKLLTDRVLPDGWELNATGKSGASGYYMEFTIKHLPTELELTQVMSLIKALE